MSQPTLEQRVKNLEDVAEGTGMILDALINKVFPDGFPAPLARADRSPEEVERLLKRGIWLINLKPMEQLLCMGFVAGYLMEAGTLTAEQTAAIQKIVTETYK